MSRPYKPMNQPGAVRQISVKVDYETDNNVAYLLDFYDGLTLGDLFEMLISQKAAEVRANGKSILQAKKQNMQKKIDELASAIGKIDETITQMEKIEDTVILTQIGTNNRVKVSKKELKKS